MESDLDQLSTNNDPPSVEDLQSARQLEADIQREIEDTEVQIVALTARLSSLKAQSSKYQTITSPFRRIPTDLLHEIFYHCLPTYRNPLLSASEAPVLLTRVCSRWRKVALSSPRLWAQMHITFCDNHRVLQSGIVSDDDDDDDDRRRAHALHILNLRCKVVHEWLTVRSGTCPLSVSIFYHSGSWNLDDINSGWEEDGNPTLELFRIITQSLYRCRRLELTMPTEVYQKLDQMITDSVPAIDLGALRALNFSCHFSQPPPIQDAITEGNHISLFKAPHLKQLSLSGVGWRTPSLSDLLLTSASGQNLTHLCYHHYLTATENLYVLKNCRSLVHCKLFISIKAADFDTDALPDETLSNAMVFLPQLLSLSIVEDTIGHSDLKYIRRFYSSINAPKLRWINHENGAYQEVLDASSDSTPTPPILPLLQKSTRLAKLTLEPRNFSTRDLKKILEVVSPTLVHLVAGHEGTLRQPMNGHDYGPRSASKNFLEWLLVDSGSHSEPLLSHLQIFESCPTRQSDEEILRFITSRLASPPDKVAPLKLVRARFYRTKQSDIKQEVAQFLAGNDLEEENSNIGAPIKLDLQYLPQLPTYSNPLSSSYAVDENDQYWNFSEINETVSQISFYVEFFH